MKRSAKLFKVDSGWEIRLCVNESEVKTFKVVNQSSDSIISMAAVLVIAESWIKDSVILKCFESDLTELGCSVASGETTLQPNANEQRPYLI